MSNINAERIVEEMLKTQSELNAHILTVSNKDRFYNLYYDTANQQFIACLGDYIKIVENEISSFAALSFSFHRDTDDQLFLIVDIIDGTESALEELLDEMQDDFSLTITSEDTDGIIKEVLDSNELDFYITKTFTKYKKKLLDEFQRHKSLMMLELKTIDKHIQVLTLMVD